MRVLLDTSVLIGDVAPGEVYAAISVVSLTELHCGVLVATDDDERALRVGRLASVEAAFDPLPVTPEVARAWGRLAAAVGCRPSRFPCSPTTSQTCTSSATSSTHGCPDLPGL